MRTSPDVPRPMRAISSVQSSVDMAADLLPTSVMLPFTCAVCHRHVLLEVTDLKHLDQHSSPAEWTCARCSTKHLLPLIGRVAGVIESTVPSVRGTTDRRPR